MGKRICKFEIVPSAHDPEQIVLSWPWYFSVTASIHKAIAALEVDSFLVLSQRSDGKPGWEVADSNGVAVTRMAQKSALPGKIIEVRCRPFWRGRRRMWRLKVSGARTGNWCCRKLSICLDRITGLGMLVTNIGNQEGNLLINRVIGRSRRQTYPILMRTPAAPHNCLCPVGIAGAFVT